MEHRIKRQFILPLDSFLFLQSNKFRLSTISRNALTCALNQPQIDYFLVSLLVSNGYGRTYNSPSLLRASTDDIVYHAQTYAGKQ